MSNWPRHPGFALVLVLWVVAGLSVIAATVGQNALQLNQAAKTSADRADAERSFAQTQAKLLFTLASSSSSAKGRLVGQRVLRVDGTWYQSAADDFVSVQDARGLLNLNRLSREAGRLLLSDCGVPPEQAEALLDALADYIDGDDLKRLNGAEAAEYRDARLAPPANRSLLSVAELWRVLGWAKYRASWSAKGCDDHVAVSADYGFNFNSATKSTLIYSGFSPDYATALLNERNNADGQAQVLSNNYASFNLSDNPFSGSGMLARPGNVYRVRHWHRSGASLQYWVVLPIQRLEPPWVLVNPSQDWSPAWTPAVPAPTPDPREPRPPSQSFAPLPVRNLQDSATDASAPPADRPF